ncbi:MAG: D-alanine--D-alanine ligase [Gammaproteobacteria bacterium]|nr:D-alanine--D-alanine ligase [Gammaproteobacteria bacterium]
MTIALVYGAPPPGAAPDDLDVLVQLAAVRDALRVANVPCREFALDDDLAAAHAWLRQERPELVFNLVEAIHGRTDRIAEAPALFAELRLPFTGSDAEALRITTHKLLSKERMQRDGIATPAWCCDPLELRDPMQAGAWIVKPIDEDASVGIDDDAVCQTAAAAAACLEARTRRGGNWFAERFIAGREINIALLAHGAAVDVLPPAEILFDAFAPGKPHIVGYAAKWQPDSFEYRHTPRDFERLAHEPNLCRELGRIARRCWDLFELSGYARVDCRVDAAGSIWVLEVNANPCLSPDAGLAAAAARAGLDYPALIARIVAAARPRTQESLR